MPQPYPDPNFNTTTGFFRYVNTVTQQWMFTLFLIACPIVLFSFMKFQQYKTSDSLAVSFFLTFILGALLWAGGLVAGKIVILFLVFTVASVLYSIFDN